MIRAKLVTLILATAFILAPYPAGADYLTIRLGVRDVGHSDYFHELLLTALTESGHLVAMEQVEKFPHLRERSMLETGELDVTWLIRSPERDQRYIPIPVGLTQGLIGRRILLVADRHKNIYRNVTDLSDFRRMGMIGGFGANWYDVGVWEVNHLPYQEVADPGLIYDIVAAGDRGIDYFSRGFNEVLKEAEEHPDLVIEPHIMLVYDRDFVFYVSPKRTDLVPILTDAMARAEESGLIERLVHKHFARSFEVLQPENRVIIPLRTP